jgi:hypothetical protein
MVGSCARYINEKCITKGTIWGAASPALTSALFKDSNGICLKSSGRFPIPGVPLSPLMYECAMRLDGAETLFEIFEELYELHDGIRNKNGRRLVNVPIAQ